MSSRGLPAPGDVVSAIRSGDRAILARAITVVESSRKEDRRSSAALLDAALPFSGGSIRVGVTGVPGAGKSTFIEALGTRLLDAGRRVAVLAVDPTSELTRGSILGDKTRMPRLSAHPDAFVRPSPSGGLPGGVAPRTREVILLCEAAGYDTVLIETMGVGQSETAVHSMVDFLLLLALPGAGDELQGIKRGIVEMVDAIAVTKADGDSRKAAERARSQFLQALRLFPPTESGWKPRVHVLSSLTGEGLDALWQTISEFEAFAREGGAFDRRRREQARAWMQQAFDDLLRLRLREDSELESRRSRLESAVLEGRRSAVSAAEELLGGLFEKP